MPAGDGDRIDRLGAQLIGQLAQFGFVEGAQGGGFGDTVEKRRERT